ncbi:MAG: [FeFe] hydrogenase H-cluster radical SAM maturase HydG [Lentisphaerae bacterium RIFOXYB12_FULL_65_16]|nr:MAG: [FeFe] hydrogenase H-cluster radical SAM maturase HydG [Lentisphaerae bacterium RIFOXYA12_64_32]OGV86078.1 MAG: [FeFe] hydrogenase H-cluster radical SAM maturase HydG [Lentisphaerae bacterium RIFOXYB12_FULL_65_16]
MPQTAGLVDFIPAARIEALLQRPPATPAELDAVLAKSLAKQRLELDEMAVLLSVTDPAQLERIFAAARELKKTVYGNRIVLFAPLYIGNKCINSCRFCGFRQENTTGSIRRTLKIEELRAELTALENKGHKRLILVFGEHPDYDPDFMAECVRTCYQTKVGHGEIRRVNINAAPLDVEGYRKLKAVGIGTYQIFQESYHRPTYASMCPKGPKSDFLWRLYGLDRAQEAGCDDVGIGALLGLYDWRFEALGLLAHTVHLEERFHVGPHTISFPRLKVASNVDIDRRWEVSDADFKRLIAILRLSVPYTGMILTARESPEVRRELIQFGCSQIDAGTRIELGGYSDAERQDQDLRREQFKIGDARPLDEVVAELLDAGEIPSYCTACYRRGRTGEHFMEFAIPGFIKRFCTPNALLTLKEYLVDYASPGTRVKGERLMAAELTKMPESEQKAELLTRIAAVERGDRDLFF